MCSEHAPSSAGRLLRACHDATTELAAEDLPGRQFAAMDTVAVRLQSLVAFMRRSAADGDENLARHIADGHAGLHLRDIDHIKANTATWQKYIANH
ncbi:hypothetical protein ACFWVT_27370 [Streptomyces cyaneofuscatus]|uniref:hypothetical protein n=1 Tax=Streptomyces cyaneofuscatus TaxID=66883 RepID=UPI0036477AA5